MDIFFANKKLEKELTAQTMLVTRHGPYRAKLLKNRLTVMRAAVTLEDLHSLPQVRCHELTVNRAGQLSIDLDHPYRLIFVPANDPIPRKPDRGLDWTRITAVTILGVEDTHE